MTETSPNPNSGTAVPKSACEDNHSRSVKPVEGPCPLCGAGLEFFSDELITKESLRCVSCRGRFDVDTFKKTATFV
ncbi:MAG: hypothetical protein LBO05_02920 [Deltaproteobacteria bacterium]|jgi:hypothetical protein|nr:hypothetical protein [Deltaproteobacteria bacterium]